MRRTLLALLMPAVPFMLQAQCPDTEPGSCTAVITPDHVVVTGTQTLGGSYQCFHVPTGANLDYGGTYSVFLVESGGSVNVNGVGNLVLAKSGATVGFCGSGYGNRLDHEPGVAMDCTSSNTVWECAEVTFEQATGVGTVHALPVLRYDPADDRLHVSGAPSGMLDVLDAGGRRVRTGSAANGALHLHGLAPGVYLARLVEQGVLLRFVRR
ncbi:MAG: hypothetical protein RBT71_01185 [Flavobacteriales bacterium]|jgi:hypothetical protein|nr:hypothetical protein [Flavobacteriales bacterium]